MKKTVLLLILPLLAACVSTGNAVGMANPAAKFCVERGGYLEPKTDARGNQFALCHLPDGRVVDEWTYFREHH